MAETLETGTPEAPEAPAEAGRGAARRSRAHRVVLALSFAIALGLPLAGWILTPDARGVGTHEQLGMAPCATMELWNVPCPGCGVTTSLVMASQGRLVDAARNQPFGFALWVAAIGFVLWCWLAALRGHDLGRRVRALNVRGWLWAAGVVAAASWLYKLGLVRGW